ncbi:hypothetical protein Fot_35804 [Forsythia ovata]|uniref:Uncharacterized protein n=1 Tax=Forsythia ovata TaxID=205694 RepID=A0ABD1SMK0_9LAMI
MDGSQSSTFIVDSKLNNASNKRKFEPTHYKTSTTRTKLDYFIKWHLNEQLHDVKLKHLHAPRAYLLVAKGRVDRAQHGGVQGSNPEILDLCFVASGSYHMFNSLGLSINSSPWLLGGISCDLPPPPRA